MCSLYSVLFFLGLALLQLPTTVASCPPSNPPVGAKTIQFCSGSEVTSNIIYIDSSDVSNQVTNCTCIFNARNDTTVLLTTTTNQITDCRTNIKYGQQNGVLANFCGTISFTQPIRTGFNYILLLTNGLIGLIKYCLQLIPGINSIDINLKCFQETHVTTATTTSTEPSVKTKDTTASDSSSGASSTGTTDTGTQTSEVTVQHSATSTNTDENKSPVLYILLLTTIGSLLLIGCIILVCVVYIRRCSKKKNVYESSIPTSDLHVYENRISTTTVEENNHNVTEYEICNFNRNCTDLTNTTVDEKKGYTELQFSSNHENTMSPSIYTELQTTAVDIDHGYTQLNRDTDDNIESNSELGNGDYENLKATV